MIAGITAGAVVAWAAAIVVTIVTLTSAITGLATRARADENGKQVETLKTKIDDLNVDRLAEKMECDRNIAALKARVDDLTNGWLERLAPEVARIMAPYLVEDLRAPLADAVREAAK